MIDLRSPWVATAIAIGAGALLTIAAVVMGLEMGILLYVFAGICIVGLLLRLDVAITWTFGVVLGSIFLFQVSTIPVALKGGFVAVTAVMACFAAHSLFTRLGTLDAQIRRGVALCLWGVLIMVLILAWQLVALLWNQVPVDAWMRDALNYLMVPIVAIIGLEAGFRMAMRYVVALTLIAGVIGAYSYTVAWLSRRAVDDTTTATSTAQEQFGLASSFLVFAALALCLSRFAVGRLRAIVWLIGALGIMGLMVTAGGRQTIVQCVVEIVVVLLLGSGGLFARVGRIAVGALLAVVALMITLDVSASLAEGIANDRIQFFQRVSQEGISAVLADQSAVARLRALDWLVGMWQQKPLLGWGFGHNMLDVTTGVVGVNIFTLDSPMVALEKFGVIGTIALVAVLILFGVGLWQIARRGAPASLPFGRLFWLLTGIQIAITIPNGFPMENRGFPPYVLLFTLIIVSNAAGNWSPEPDGEPSQDDERAGEREPAGLRRGRRIAVG